MTPLTNTAKALERCQKSIYINEIHYFDCATGKDDCGDTSGLTLTGKDNTEKAFHFFVDKGLTPEQSAAIVGNLVRESNVNPTATNGTHNGIAQWDIGGRWDTNGPTNGQPGNLTAYAQSKNTSTDDLLTQLNFMWLELSNNYKPALDAVKAAGSIEDAAVIFQEKYEVADLSHDPNSDINQKSIRYAHQVMTDYGGSTASGSTATTGNCANDTNCNEAGNSTTRAAILCEARKFDPWGYLWGGGHEDPEQFMENWNNKGGFNLDQHPFEQVVDCSGLVIVALWNAYHVKTLFAVPEDAGGVATMTLPNFEDIPIDQTEPGDLVFKVGHVEIVSSAGAKTTFGAHTANTTPEKQIGENNADAATSGWTRAMRYTGPGIN